MMNINFSNYYQPRPKQLEAHACKAKYLLFGGAMGGGKSFFLCGDAIYNALKYPGNRLVIIRKELSVLRRTVLVTFFKVCPPRIIRNYNQSKFEIIFINGSVLTFIEADINRDPLLEKIKGLECGWAAIDEASEISVEVYRMLKTRLRWVLPDGSKPSYEIRLTSNPESCWLIPTFIQTTNKDEVYIQSLTSDNYAEDSEYIQNLKDAFKDSPNLLRKYLYADWSLSDSINQLISNETIKACSIQIQGRGAALGVDVARYGNDKTAFVLIKDGNVKLIESYQHTSTTEVSSRVIQLINDYGIDSRNVGIDGIGIGAGVIDELKQRGYDVVEIVGGAKPEEPDSNDTFKPFNLRSQMYYELRKSLIAGEIGNLTDEALKLELQAIKYEIHADKTLRVISKDAIKKILGRSPDLADALCYAVWVLKKNERFPIICVPPRGGV